MKRITFSACILALLFFTLFISGCELFSTSDGQTQNKTPGGLSFFNFNIDVNASSTNDNTSGSDVSVNNPTLTNTSSPVLTNTSNPVVTNTSNPALTNNVTNNVTNNKEK